MGDLVYLHVDTARVDAPRWEALWHEAVEVTRAFPDGAITLTKIEVAGVKLSAYSPDVIVEVDGSRCIQVVGDARWLCRAELFELPQRLPRPSARVDARPRLRNQSLLSTVDGYGTPGARRVFGAQTAGYPYHRLVVALATLVENRLPGLALASGGLDPSDGEEACALLEHVLGETFAPPIVVDEPRLRAELAACFEEPALTERLTALLREPSHPIFGDLLGVLMKGSAGIRRDLERRVAGLRNLDEIGEMTREFLCRMAVSLAKAFRRHELQDATIVRCGSTIATSSCESSRVRVSC